jgi:hypothetical protein
MCTSLRGAICGVLQLISMRRRIFVGLGIFVGLPEESKRQRAALIGTRTGSWRSRWSGAMMREVDRNRRCRNSNSHYADGTPA